MKCACLCQYTTAVVRTAIVWAEMLLFSLVGPTCEEGVQSVCFAAVACILTSNGIGLQHNRSVAPCVTHRDSDAPSLLLLMLDRNREIFGGNISFRKTRIERRCALWVQLLGTPQTIYCCTAAYNRCPSHNHQHVLVDINSTRQIGRHTRGPIYLVSDAPSRCSRPHSRTSMPFAVLAELCFLL